MWIRGVTDTLQGAEGYPSEGVTDSAGLGSFGLRRSLALAPKGFGGASLGTWTWDSVL